ncbi:Endo-1,4-beta-xylanase [Hirschia baltica ATCC 49814]|uniref:Beta-xylanase n=2 Tax=Hirschia TaxID=2723 RepID=C6XRN4_HIRBI|nr:Endo-1,4-beta-xylanase [Hirschia baltica ATCC 49814]
MTEIDARQRLKFLVGGVSLLALGSCSGGGGGSSPTPTPTSTSTPIDYEPTSGLLRNTYRNNFKIGSAALTPQIDANDPIVDLLKSQFNSMMAEYEMKADVISPSEGVYDFSAGDKLVAFAEANGFELHGHTLLWHSSTPDYFFLGSKDEIKTKLQNYVTEVVTHFKGKVHSWHVVNEVVSDSASETTAPYRNSDWYQAVGSAEYIDWAFEAAHAADPDALLFINEYNTEFEDKRGRLIEIVEDLLDRNIPIHGVGHQCHLDYRDAASSVLSAIDAVDDLFAGLVNHITEMDMSVYGDPGSCWQNETGCDADFGANVPAERLKLQAQIFRDLFNGLILRPSVENVSFWGVSDAHSWLNERPTERTNYPLLFDRNYKAKPAFRAITDSNYVI